MTVAVRDTEGVDEPLAEVVRDNVDVRLAERGGVSVVDVETAGVGVWVLVAVIDGARENEFVAEALRVCERVWEPV